MWYNVRVKTFPDGHKQYFWSENPILRWDDIPEEYRDTKKRRIFHLEKPDGRYKNNMNRSVNQVYDLARANCFDWFITLTLDPKRVDRTDYEECAIVIRLFTKRLQRNGNKWLLVPELHKDGKSYHFHGLIQGDLDLTHWKGDVYNLNNFEFGYTTAMPIQDPQRVASYIAKYLTKDIAVPKGKKSFWASRSLAKPEISYMDELMEDIEFVWGYFEKARYKKIIDGKYGRYLIAEE